MGARGRHVTGGAAGAARGGTRGAMAGGDDGSWVELWCGPGCPEPVPSRFSCHADVEQMLLEAQLETESSEGALLALGSPAWDEDGAGLACEQPGESKLLPTHSQPQLGCPPPCQVRMPPVLHTPAVSPPQASPASVLLAGCVRGNRVEGAAPDSIPGLGPCLPPSASVSKGVCLCVLPPASDVEPARRCSGEKEETFQFRASAALHSLCAAQPPADPGTGDLHREAAGSLLSKLTVKSWAQ